jgi:hypothetical protein
VDEQYDYDNERAKERNHHHPEYPLGFLYLPISCVHPAVEPLLLSRGSREKYTQ